MYFRLAQEREAYLKNKRLTQEEMRSALDNQVNNQLTNCIFKAYIFLVNLGSK